MSWSSTSFLKWSDLDCPQIWLAYIKCEIKSEQYIVLRRYFGVQCRILARRPMALLSFGIKVFKWGSHGSESFRKTTRYFALIVRIIFWPLILKLGCFVISYFLFLKTIISVLPILRESLLVRIHWQRPLRSLFYRFVDFLKIFFC